MAHEVDGSATSAKTTLIPIDASSGGDDTGSTVASEMRADDAPAANVIPVAEGEKVAGTSDGSESELPEATADAL